MATVQEFMNKFIEGTLGRKTKEGRWSVERRDGIELLVYQPKREDLLENVSETLACRFPDGTVLVNANRLRYIGAKCSYGKIIRSRGKTNDQIFLERNGAVPIPFTLFDEAGVDISQFAWVVKPNEEYVISRTPFNNRIITSHFSGACVFRVGDKYYLYDIDRKELDEHKLFNPFLVNLPKPVQTIDEAYDSLMPDEVRDAIRTGVEVQRQGELFFVKTSNTCPVEPPLTDEERQILRYPPSRTGFGLIKGQHYVWQKDDVEPFSPNKTLTETEAIFQESALKYQKIKDRIRKFEPTTGTIMIPGRKQSRIGHSATTIVTDEHDTSYVSGIIAHRGRQHGDLKLDGWWKVVPNMAIASFTIVGDVD